MKRCHQALKVAILVNRISVFVSLCVFKVNGLITDGTNWSVHTSPGAGRLSGTEQILSKGNGFSRPTFWCAVENSSPAECSTRSLHLKELVYRKAASIRSM